MKPHNSDPVSFLSPSPGMSRHGSVGGHHSPRMQRDEWLTPPGIIESLGPFDLDPCSPVRRPWDTARKHYSVLDNGLALPWEGRVWLNPPYGRETERWLALLAAHGNGIALIFARTETAMFRKHVWGAADAILFLHQRLHFHDSLGIRAEANSGAPSCLVAYGQANVQSLRECGLAGSLVAGWEHIG